MYMMGQKLIEKLASWVCKNFHGLFKSQEKPISLHAITKIK